MDLQDVQDAQDDQGKGGARSLEVGVVTSLSPLRANCSGYDELVTNVSPVTPALNDGFLMARVPGTTYLIARVGTGMTAPTPPVVEISGSKTFPAAYSFSWRDGMTFDYRTDVRQGSLDASGAWSGAWFYQGGPGAELFGATVTGCAVKVTRISGGTPGSQPVAIYQSSTGSWPVADLSLPPTPVGSAITQNLAVGESQWVTLPNSVGQALVDGDAGLMITDDSPMVLLAGTDTDPESGLLRIDWTR